MGNKLKRYVVKMDMYVYAENDYMARKRAHKLSKTLNIEKYKPHIETIKEVDEFNTYSSSQFKESIYSQPESNYNYKDDQENRGDHNECCQSESSFVFNNLDRKNNSVVKNNHDSKV